jgi:hypothetical protein
MPRGLRVGLLVLIGDDVTRLPWHEVRREVVSLLDTLDDQRLRALMRITRLTAKSQVATPTARGDSRSSAGPDPRGVTSRVVVQLRSRRPRYRLERGGAEE